MNDEFPQYLITLFWLQKLLTWWVNEDLEGGACDLLQGTIPKFV